MPKIFKNVKKLRQEKANSFQLVLGIAEPFLPGEEKLLPAAHKTTLLASTLWLGKK